MDIQRESLEMITERTGSPAVATATFWVWFIGGWVAALTTIVAAAWAFNHYVLPLLTDSARRAEMPSGVWASLALVLTTAIFGYWRFRVWKQTFMRRLQTFLELTLETTATTDTTDDLSERINAIEQRVGIGPRRRSALDALYIGPKEDDPFTPSGLGT